MKISLLMLGTVFVNASLTNEKSVGEELHLTVEEELPPVEPRRLLGNPGNSFWTEGYGANVWDPNMYYDWGTGTWIDLDPFNGRGTGCGIGCYWTGFDCECNSGTPWDNPVNNYQDWCLPGCHRDGWGGCDCNPITAHMEADGYFMPAAGCDDKNTNMGSDGFGTECEVWESNGACHLSEYFTYMNDQCQATCGFCHSHPHAHADDDGEFVPRGQGQNQNNHHPRHPRPTPPPVQMPRPTPQPRPTPPPVPRPSHGPGGINIDINNDNTNHNTNTNQQTQNQNQGGGHGWVWDCWWDQYWQQNVCDWVWQ